MAMNLAGSPWIAPNGESNYAYYEMMARQAAAPAHAEAQKAKSEAQSAYAALADMQSTAQEIAAERDQWEKWGRELDAKVTYWKNYALTLENGVKLREEMIETRNKKIATLQNQSNPANSDAYRALQQELESVKKHRDECLNWGKGLQQKLETTTQELATTKQQLAASQKQCNTNYDVCQSLRQELATTKQEFAVYKKSFTHNVNVAKSLEQKLVTTTQELATTQQQRDRFEKRMYEEGIRGNKLWDERNALQKERDSLKSQLEATKDDILEVLPRMREYEEAMCQMRAFAQACGNVLNKTLPLSAKAQILEQGQNLYTRDPERDARWTQNPLESEGFAKLGQGFVQKLRGWQQQIKSGGGDDPDKTPQSEKDVQQAEDAYLTQPPT